jgi:hypothetical protein
MRVFALGAKGARSLHEERAGHFWLSRRDLRLDSVVRLLALIAELADPSEEVRANWFFVGLLLVCYLVKYRVLNWRGLVTLRVLIRCFILTWYRFLF